MDLHNDEEHNDDANNLGEHHSVLQLEEATNNLLSEEMNTVHIHGHEESMEEKKITPLPKLQMIIISLVIISEAVGYSILYPVVPFMVRDFLLYQHNHEGNISNNSTSTNWSTTFDLYPISKMGNNFASLNEEFTILNNNYTNSTNGTDVFEIPEGRVGLMIGILASSLSLAQLASNWFIARASDHLGRKPFLLSGMIFNVILMSMFSVSRTFWFALVVRIANGLLNANIPIYKSFLMDITDDTNQEKAFIIISILWAVSNIIAPGVGGLLVNFAEKFPILFGGESSIIYSFFKSNPFILPLSIPVIMNIVTIGLSFFFLKESLEKRFNIINWIKLKFGRKKKGEDAVSVEMIEGAHHSNMDEIHDKLIKLSEDGKQMESEPQKTSSENSILFLLKDSTVVKVVSLYLFLGIFSNMADELVPIFCSNSVKRRGLGLDSLTIGMILSVGGVTSLVMLFIYPKVSHKLGFLWLYRIGLAIYGVVILFLPFSTEMIRLDWSIWIVLAFFTFCIFIKSCSHSIMYTSQFLMVNNASPSPEHIGSMNGLGHITASVGWSIGPFVAGFLVDVGLKWSEDIETAAPNSFFALVPFVDKLCFFICALICFWNWFLSFTVPKTIVAHRRYEKPNKSETTL